jgi:hypothetical protein
MKVQAPSPDRPQQNAISAKLVHSVPIAILPVENLSSAAAPLKRIRGLLTERLKSRGFTVLDNRILEEFMARHRIRYTGGIDREDARKLKDETGAGAVLITSVELYSNIHPPKIAATSRLVATEGDKRRILWMDSVGLAGDSAPGVLGLGLIKDPDLLVQTAAGNLSDSLENYLSGNSLRSGARARKRTYQPKMQYGSAVNKEEDDPALAVVPFYNLSSRGNAGEILSLHFARALKESGIVSVVEPGDVRTSLLGARVILDDGISLANADLISNRLDVDLILTGRVFDYQDYRGPGGTTKIDFSVLVLDRKSRRVVWYSRSENKGDDRVYLFDWGMLKTANELAAEMVDSVVHSMLDR